MKNIVDYIDERDEIIFELDENDFIEDPETYNHFVNEVFFKELDEFIENHYEKSKGKITPIDPLLSDATKVGLMLKNDRVRAKYVIKFDQQRQRFYLYKGKFYTYTIQGGFIITPIVVHRYEKEEILKHLNIYCYMRNRSFLRYILDRIKEFLSIKIKTNIDIQDKQDFN